MTIPALYPAATWEPVDYIGEAGPLGSPLGWVEHVVVGNGDPLGTFEHAVPPNRRFSHLWFPKHGHGVRQYQLLTRASWAQGAGNGAYWSCETEGDPGEPLTDDQLDDLAAWHVWSGTADAIASLPGQRGIGTHGMGGTKWGGHPDCPGTIRAGQRAEILRRAAALRQGGTMAKFTAADLAPVWASEFGPKEAPETAGQRLAAAAAALPAIEAVEAHLTRVEAKLDQLLAARAGS